MNTSGVYQIVNIASGKCYIGSAINFKKRWDTHKRQLKNNKHHSILLQRAWNKYGEENFKFEVLITCEKEELLDYEQLHFDELKPEYNIAKVAGSLLGIKYPEEFGKQVSERLKGNKYTLGHKASKETKDKMSKSHKGCKPSPEILAKAVLANTGRKHTEEELVKMRKPKSEQAKVNMSECRIGGKASEETKAKMSVTRIANHAKKLEGFVDIGWAGAL